MATELSWRAAAPSRFYAALWLAAAVLALGLTCACGRGRGLDLDPESKRTPALEQDLGVVLAQLERGSPPEGVDPAVFDELRRELSRVLQDTWGSRLVSGAPQGSANAVDDLAIVSDGAGGELLQWSYLNAGDYDQNSVVGVTDLTPIGIHFGKDDSDPEWDSFAFVDGDGNGRISVTDVTPIGLNYLSKVAHYEVATYDAGSLEYSPVGESAFSSSSESPRRFSIPLPEGTAGMTLAVRPADGAGSFGPWSEVPAPEPIDTLPGPVGDAAVLHIPDMPPPLPETSDFFILEDNFALSHTLLAAQIGPAVSVGAVNNALAAISASIIGADPHCDMLYLRIDSTGFPDMQAALESLIDSGAVEAAAMEMCGAPEILPLHTTEAPSLWTFETPNYSTPPLASANWWLKAIRAPQAWNLETHIRRAQAGNNVEAAVIDGGFDTAHEDVGARIDLGGTPNSGVFERDHGTMCAGIIGADGGNGIGMAGVYPWGQKIHGRLSRIAIGGDLIPWNQQIHAIVDLLTSRPSVRAVNNSYGHSGFYTPGAPAVQIDPETFRFGDRTGDGDADDPGEWPFLDLDRNGTSDTYAQVMALLGRMYNAAIAAYSAERGNGNFIIAASAGNAGTAYRTQDNSPIANAAVTFGGSFISVEATTNLNSKASFSDINGTLSAPGKGIRSSEASNLDNYDSLSETLRDDGSSLHFQSYATQNGTSFAAPQACALACLLWKLDPTLTAAQVRTLLSAAPYTWTTGNAPRLDCFSAALGIDTLRGDHAIQLALADVDDGSSDGNQREEPFTGLPVGTIATVDQRRGDGSIDMSDFRAFRDAWLLTNSASLALSGGSVNVSVGLDGNPSHFKNDLNYDGVIGLNEVMPPHPVDIGVPPLFNAIPSEDVFPRCDLNGDGRISFWTAAAPVKLDPDSGFDFKAGFDLLPASETRRDLDVLLDPALWSDSVDGYLENAGNIKALEGSLEDNGSWLPRRFILDNRDSGITAPAAAILKGTPDYLHSFDFHLRINWDGLDPGVTGVHVELASDVWPDGIDNNDTGGTDEPFEVKFERYRDFSRAAGTQDFIVTMPLWTGALKLSWEAIGAGGDCVTMVTRSYSGLAFGQDFAYTLPGDSTNGDWDIQTLDQAGGAGEHSSIALVSGNPAIAYLGSDDVRYIRASNADGSSWGAPLDVASNVSVGVSINLALVAGNPGIGYSDSSFDHPDLGLINSVSFVHSSSPTGMSWDAPVASALITTGIPQMGWHNDLLAVGGKPAMCFLGEDYEDINGTALNFVSATQPDGSGPWNDPERPDSAGSPEGLWCSVELVEGNPAIAYLSSVNNMLCFVRASSADGSAWGTPLQLDGAGGFDYFDGPYPGKHASMAIVNGKPAISYYGGSDLEFGSMLKYIQASNATGSAWEAPLILHTGDSNPGAASGLYSSLATIGGVPAVSFHNMGDGKLLYIEAVDPDGLLWFESEEVDCTGDVGRWSSLCELSGSRAAISYYDASAGALKFARQNSL